MQFGQSGYLRQAPSRLPQRSWNARASVLALVDDTGATATCLKVGKTTEADTREALTRSDPLLDELFPAEQARIAALLVERIDIGTDGLNVRLRTDGLTGLAPEIVVAILNGKHGQEAALAQVLEPFPLEWSRQEAHFTNALR